jgi:hypothetical protein
MEDAIEQDRRTREVRRNIVFFFKYKIWGEEALQYFFQKIP